MRDLLSKLDGIISETALNPNNPKGDYQAKRKALQDLQMDPVANDDPEISAAIAQRKADLEKEAKEKGVTEGGWDSGDLESWETRFQQAYPEKIKSIAQNGGVGVQRTNNDVATAERILLQYWQEKGEKLTQAHVQKAKDKIQADVEKEKSETENISFEIGDDFGISFSEDFEIGTEIVDILEDGIVIQLDDSAIEYLANEGFTFEEGELTEGVAGPQSCWKGYRKVGTKPGTGKNAGKRVNDCEKIDEYFFFDKDDEDKDPRAHDPKDDEKRAERRASKGQDKLAKRGSGNIAKHPQEYKAMRKGNRFSDMYKINGPQGKLPEDQMSEGKSYGTLPADVIRKLYGAYQEASQGVEQYRDAEGAERIYSALKDVAREHGAMAELKSLMYSASQSAHMDFDTHPGDFKNWFTYVGDHLEALKKIHDKKEEEPDVELDDSIEMEAKYQGREVPLGKPMKGDVKKSKVYVKNPQGNVVKVNFGDKKMRIKKSNPNRRKSFRARHNCSNPGPRHKARYWSCRAW
jgi:hypothetical protein